MKPNSPWYTANDDIKVAVHVPPFARSKAQNALISNLTPQRLRVRIGVLIDGRESSMTVPFELAIEFAEQVKGLILEKGVR